MLAALLSFPRGLRKQKAREWARRSHVVRMGNAAAVGPTFEALRKRALDDARGQVLRHGVTYSAQHPQGQPWAILRSKAGGRINQVDLHVGNQLVRTCALRDVLRGMARARL